MIINITIPSFYPAVIYGGPVYSSLNTAKSLARLGHEVFVSTTNTNLVSRLEVEPNKLIPLSENLHVKYYNETIINRFSLPLLLNLKNDLKKADVIHVQAIFNTPTPIALFYSNLLNKPVLLSPRGVLGNWIMNQGISFKKSWLKFFVRPFSEKIYWHATSGQERDEILSLYPKARVFIIPNGIDPAEYKSINISSRAEFVEKFAHCKVSPSHVIISMGRIHKKKGFDILIKAFSEVRIKHSDAYLLIAGEDEGEKENLLFLVNELGQQNHIFFTGAIHGEDKINFLAGADVFALPSHNENFGNVYAESLAAGTPIVASKHTPWNDVEKYDCGHWVNNTSEETASAILSILSKDRAVQKDNAMKYIAQFSWENIGKKFEEVFLKIKAERITQE